MKILQNTISAVSLWFAVAASMGLAGCGSSGGGGPVTPNGVFSGSITGGATGGAPINGGEKGIIYDNRMMVFSTVLNIQQIFDAPITITGNTFTGNLSYYNNSVSLADTADLSADFVTNVSVSASFTSATNLPDGTINLTSDSALYNKDSDQALLVAIWSGIHSGISETSAPYQTTTISIDAAGVVTGTDTEGCTIAGSVMANNTSINVYDVTLTYSGCGEYGPPDGAYTGLAWVEGSSNEILNLVVADGNFGRAVVLSR